jgi:repressor LexA
VFFEKSFFTTIEKGKYMTKRELLKRINNGKERGAQAILANKIGISTASVANWFTGRNYPTEENIKRIASAFKLELNEVRKAFYEDDEFAPTVNAIPLTPSNTIQLPILADVPAGLPDFSDRDVEMFVDIPRFLFPGADFVVKCIGDSLEPKIKKGDYCVIRKMEEPLEGKAMLVKSEEGACMKVIKKQNGGVPLLCSTNPKYKPFTPKQLTIIGLIIGHWSRDDRETWS